MTSMAESGPGTPAELSQLWDVVVIGTGVGGATVGYALAQRGFSVLFLEKGTSVAAGQGPADVDAPGVRLERGWWPQPISQRRADGTTYRFYGAIGCALGGSSIHYGAGLERMARSDFDALQTPRQFVPPWPVSFDAFLPFYEAAESVYGITPRSQEGDRSRLSDWDRSLMEAMRKNGLRPEQLRVAIRYDENCEECIGKVCHRRCKADARTACLDEALRHPRCRILDHCDVQTLEADHDRVRTIHAVRHDRPIEVRGKIIVLAAGAMHSPQLLLKSRNSFWPRGLANRSDQVGRNLMFHTLDLYALWAPRKLDRRARQKKSLSVRDFYVHENQRLGYIQSMGPEAGRGDIAAFLKDALRRHGLRNELLLSSLVKLPSHVASWMFGRASILAANTEDDPDPENRIELDDREPDGAIFKYSIAADLRQRADRLHDEFKRHVRPWRLWRLTSELTMNYGHPCGTCRFGAEPAGSVLNADCRAHDVENLYVIDASFMPRSGAVMPSLTIAANALRVAPAIAAVLAPSAPQEHAPPPLADAALGKLPYH